MGLTIHWKLSLNGSHESVKKALKPVCDEINKSPGVNAVMEVHYYHESRDEPEKKDLFDWAWRHSDKNIGGDIPEYPKEIFYLLGDPGEMSEKVLIYLGRYGDEDHWEGSGFCKTQYAVKFIETHCLVVEWLSLLRKNGIATEVFDEGEYWETRDVSALLKVYERYNKMMAAFSDGLEDAGVEFTGEVPGYIKRRKDRLN
ncbi:MAG: hypothetical protein ISR89_04240 [Candidatus Marinimicrobia bacterium]|nr:hypothetical protein [Candidatus Neomarinimicrobiota bacterium]MBL7030354.1 hypothetical protein [Candidatus Neomarinimicrobiota bacterium]